MRLCSFALNIILSYQQSPQKLKSIMKPISLVRKTLLKRMQFLDSYKQLVNSNSSLLIEKHRALEKEESETISYVLRSLRIDQLFKKQFHDCILKAFHQIQPSVTVRKVATGSYRDIMADYELFFIGLKEKHIVGFLTRVFQLQIFNQTTIIYVLLELFVKFLRIKSLSFITDRIEPLSNPSLDTFSMLIMKGVTSAAKLNERKRTGSRLSKSHRYNTSSCGKQANNQTMEINCKTISYSHQQHELRDCNPSRLSRRFLKSADHRNSTIHSPRGNSERPRRRIIKSYKDVKQETKEKIEKSNLNLAMAAKQLATNSAQTYYRMFSKIFKEEWKIMIQLTQLEDLDEIEGQTSLKVADASLSQKKKTEWFVKYCDRIVVEACARNDAIRREMENYSEVYRSKFKPS